MAERADLLVIAAHPELEHSRVNLRLVDEARRRGATVRDLYALYPDFDVDVDAEQRHLAAAKLVCWLQPLHWYGMPPLLKLWLDEVFAFGWAYGPGGRALAGRDLWLVVSTGGGADAYRPEGSAGHAFDAFLPPYAQTAALVGMRFVPPLVLHGAHRAAEAEVDAHVRRFGERLAAWPDWPGLAALSAVPAAEVGTGERPPAAEVGAGERPPARADAG